MAKIRSQQLNPNLTGSFNLSGSFIVTGSLHSTNSVSDSGSLASRISIVEGNVGAQDLNTYATPTFAGLNLTNNTSITGSLTVSEDVSGSSTSTASFGHFTGDGSGLTRVFEGTAASASISTRLTSFSDGTATLISGSSTSTGSFGLVNTTEKINLGSGGVSIEGSSAGTLTANVDNQTLFNILHSNGDGIGAYLTTNNMVNLGARGSSKLGIGYNTGVTQQMVFNTNGDVGLGDEFDTRFIDRAKIFIESGGDVTINSDLIVTGSISGSSTSTGSFGRVETSEFSTSGTSTFSGTNIFTGNVGINSTNPTRALDVVGDIKATGDIIAENYIVSSSVVHLTQSFSSGSTIFGDSADDVHEFIGDTISGSSTSTGSFGRTITKTMSVDDVFFDGGDNPNSVNPKARFFYKEGQYDTIFGDIYHAASLGGLTFEDNYNHSTSGFNFILQNGTSALRIKGNGDGDITIGGDISGSSSSTGSFGHLVLGNRDTDASFELGRAHIGHIGFSDMAGFSHVDYDGTGTFALAQSSAGKTIVQAASGQPIAFKIGGSDKVQINSSGDLGVGIETALHKLHVVGDGFFTGNISGSSTSTGSFGNLKLGNADTDASFEFGRAHVGHIGYSDMAGFSHVDLDATTTFALAQNSSGKTIVNAANGQQIALKVNNADIASVTATGLGVGTDAPAHKLHIVGDGFFTGNVSGSAASTGSLQKLVLSETSKTALAIGHEGTDSDQNTVDIRSNDSSTSLRLVSNNDANDYYDAIFRANYNDLNSVELEGPSGRVFLEYRHTGRQTLIGHNDGNTDVLSPTLSGSAVSTASFGHFIGDGSGLENVFEGTAPSASISTRLTNTEATASSFIDGTAVLVSGSAISTGSFGRLEADVVEAKQFVISSSVTNMVTIDVSGSTDFGDTGDDTHRFTGSIFVQSGSISQELHTVTNSDRMFFGRSTRGIPVSGSSNISRFATDSGGNTIDLGYTTVDGDGKTVLTAVGDGIHNDLTNYWYNNNFFRVGTGGELDGANFQGLSSQYVHYDLDSLRVKGNIIATTGSLQGEVFINSPSGSSMFIGKFTGGIPVSGSDNISRYATGSDGSTVDLGFTTLDGDGNSVIVTTGDGIYVDDNNYWYTTGHFKVGSSTNQFNWNTTDLSFTGPLTASGDLVPSVHNTYDLGADSYRWANIYTADLQLSNENATPNEIDGTTGSWTIQEGEDDLYLLNRKNGKKYRFKLEEIE